MRGYIGGMDRGGGGWFMIESVYVIFRITYKYLRCSMANGVFDFQYYPFQIEVSKSRPFTLL